MKLKEVFCKYNYLFRLTIIVSVCLFIPVLMLDFLVVQRSYQKMDDNNKANYFEITQYFAGYFDEQISKFADHALRISIERKIIRDIVEENTWNTIEVVTQTLVDYRTAVPMAGVIGIHFRGSDYVLTSGYKYSLDRFARVHSKGDFIIKKEIENFLTSDHDERTFIFSTFDKLPYKAAKLYIGVPVSINATHDAVVFYILDYNAMKGSFLGELGYKNYGLYIFNLDGTLLYTNGNTEMNLFSDVEFREFLADKQSLMFEYNYGENFYNIFKYYDDNQKRMFLSVILRDQVEQNLKSFYETIKNTLALTAVGLVLLLAMSVYVGYRPILKLSKWVRSNGDDGSYMAGEIGLIERTLNRLSSENTVMHETISEQRMILIDYIFNNLLNGVSVPEGDIEWLNNNLKAKRFCVISVSGLKLNNMQRALAVKKIFNACGSHVYITDMLYEKYTVLICTIDESISRVRLITSIEQSLKESCDNTLKMGVGNPVNKLIDIHGSYLNSLSALEAEGMIVFFEDLPKTLPNVEQYPDKDVMRFIRYVKNGEKDDALGELESIRKHISKNVLSILVERYICYEILGVYVKTLKQIDMPLNKQESDSMLRFNNVNEMCELMAPTVVRVCDSISHRKKDSKNELNDSIVKYVNNNFTDPNLSLMQVADNYNISIYTLSRLFKEITGIGFKEYVTEKRIELSKRLLITTNKKIGEISAEVGFGSVSHFTRVFKSNCGISPSKYGGS